MRTKKCIKTYIQKNRKKFFAIGCTATFFMTAGIFGSTMVKANSDDVERCKYYTVVEVTKGLTLWDISQEYMTEEYMNWGQYADEVMLLNHLTDTDLKSGNFIVVPYYSN